MRTRMNLFLLAFVGWALASGCLGAKILGVFHGHSRSHHVIGAVILRALAERGHQVTMLSPFPLPEPPDNYRDVNLNDGSAAIKALGKDLIQDFNEKPVLEAFAMFLSLAAQQTETVFQNAAVRELIRSGEKFDLVIMDWFFNEAHLVFGDVFDAPVILVSSFGTSANVDWVVGNTAPLSYVPSKGSSFGEDMSFFERFANVFLDLVGKLLMMVTRDGQQKMMRKYFEEARDITQLADRVALVFSNEHYSFDQAKPSVPNIIAVGGVHVEPPKKLPEDLQVFLDQAEEGVVYFSLGSNMKSSFLDATKRDELMKAFAKTRLKVLMKYEDDNLPNKPGNVRIAKWLPQNDILAHANVKVFITHGGLLSVIEAIYHAVPIIGIPIFGDQTANVPRAVRAGYGLQIDLNNITEESVRASISKILSDSKYADNVRKRSILLKQRPLKPLDEAVFWVEHVLEHGGANHLRNWSLHLAWYEYLLLDVAAFVVGVVLVASVLAYVGTKKIFLWRKTKAAATEVRKKKTR